MEMSIQIGMSLTKHFVVDETHSAPHVGSGSVRVLATPWMIAFMEITARHLLDQHVPHTHTSVGTHVDVRHLAACAVGGQVEARVEVVAFDGRRVTLDVELLEGARQIGAGRHERMIIDKEKFLARVEAESQS